MAIQGTSWKINVPSNPEEINYTPNEKHRKEFPSLQEIAQEKREKEAAKAKQARIRAELLEGWTKV